MATIMCGDKRSDFLLRWCELSSRTASSKAPKSQFSYRISIIPDELQGRVNSAFRLLAFGGQPLGAALSGFLIAIHGAVFAVLVFWAWYLLLAVLTTLNGHVRRARQSGSAGTA